MRAIPHRAARRFDGSRLDIPLARSPATRVRRAAPPRRPRRRRSPRLQSHSPARLDRARCCGPAAPEAAAAGDGICATSGAEHDLHVPLHRRSAAVGRSGRRALGDLPGRRRIRRRDRRCRPPRATPVGEEGSRPPSGWFPARRCRSTSAGMARTTGATEEPEDGTAAATVADAEPHGAGGGGASDVRIAPYGLGMRILVGGGGGGQGAAGVLLGGWRPGLGWRWRRLHRRRRGSRRTRRQRRGQGLHLGWRRRRDANPGSGGLPSPGQQNSGAVARPPSRALDAAAASGSGATEATCMCSAPPSAVTASVAGAAEVAAATPAAAAAAPASRVAPEAVAAAASGRGPAPPFSGEPLADGVVRVTYLSPSTTAMGAPGRRVGARHPPSPHAGHRSRRCRPGRLLPQRDRPRGASHPHLGTSSAPRRTSAEPSTPAPPSPRSPTRSTASTSSPAAPSTASSTGATTAARGHPTGRRSAPSTRITSSPTVASWGPRRLDVFARGADRAAAPHLVRRRHRVRALRDVPGQPRRRPGGGLLGLQPHRHLRRQRDSRRHPAATDALGRRVGRLVHVLHRPRTHLRADDLLGRRRACSTSTTATPPTVCPAAATTTGPGGLPLERRTGPVPAGVDARRGIPHHRPADRPVAWQRQHPASPDRTRDGRVSRSAVLAVLRGRRRPCRGRGRRRGGPSPWRRRRAGRPGRRTGRKAPRSARRVSSSRSSAFSLETRPRSFCRENSDCTAAASGRPMPPRTRPPSSPPTSTSVPVGVSSRRTSRSGRLPPMSSTTSNRSPARSVGSCRV